MKPNVYVLVIEDNQQIIRPITELRTMIFDGVTYLLLPVEIEQPQEPVISDYKGARERIDHPRVQVLNLYRQGNITTNRIARKVGLPHKVVSDMIRDAGYETPSDRARKLIEKTIIDSGIEGVHSAVLSNIASECGTSSGIILKNLRKNKTIKQLPSGNWATN